MPVRTFANVRPAVSVRVPRVVAAVAGHDDVAVAGPDAGVPARHEVGVAGVAGEPPKPAGELEAVALREAAG